MNKSKSIGLALGGGAVLGAAHIGVLKAIEELHIPVKYVTGTSIGAFVGAFYAFGHSWSDIREIAKELKWLDISGISLSQFGVLSNKKMGDLIEKHVGEKTLTTAKKPLAMVATDLSNGEKVVLNDAPVAQAVMASTCIPGVFVPVEIDELMLVDGGIVENVPVTPLQDMGADYIIGVDLNAGDIDNKKPGNIVEVLLKSFQFTLNTSAKLQMEKADLLIQPDLSAFNRVDIDQVEDLMDAGYKAAIKTLRPVFGKNPA